jgi:hypothetical protein
MRKDLITTWLAKALETTTPAELEQVLVEARAGLSEGQYTVLLGKLISAANLAAEGVGNTSQNERLQIEAKPMNILDHPELKDLKPESEREGLLFLKAYLTAIEATIQAVKQFGLPAAEEFHRKVMADLAGKVKGQ